MSNRPIPDPVEATFRDLRGAFHTCDGQAAMSAIERRPDLDALQCVGDGLRLALAHGVTGAARRAGGHMAALRNRDLDGDEDLAIELEAMLGLVWAPALRDLPPHERLSTRLGRAIGGRGAFRRFKDELADAPDELAHFHRFTDDRRRGRARRWLAGSGLRPTFPAEPATPGGLDPHPLP